MLSLANVDGPRHFKNDLLPYQQNCHVNSLLKVDGEAFKRDKFSLLLNKREILHGVTRYS